jgi:hypothetical protein
MHSEGTLNLHHKAVGLSSTGFAVKRAVIELSSVFFQSNDPPKRLSVLYFPFRVRAPNWKPDQRPLNEGRQSGACPGNPPTGVGLT